MRGRNGKLLLHCLKEIWNHEPQSLLMAGGLAVAEALLPLIPAILSWLFVEGLESGQSFAHLVVTAGIGVAVLFGLNALRGKMYHCGLPHTENCNDLMEWEYSEKTMTMDYASLDSQEAAYLRAKIRNDYNWGSGAYFMIPQFQRLCSAVLGIVAAVVIMAPVLTKGDFWLHWSSPVFLIFAVVLTGLSAWSQNNVFVKTEALRDEYDKKSARSNWLIYNLTYREGKDIRIYGAKPLIMGALRETERDHMVHGESRLEGRAGALDGIISGLLLGGTYLFIVSRALQGALSAGSVVLFASAIYQMCESLKVLSRSCSEIFRNARRMESSFQYLEMPELLPDGSLHVAQGDGAVHIEFRDVTFCYPGSKIPAISHVSMHLRPGEKVAVVGRNGSGKTTMIKLLCRLYDPQEGQILLNGKDIREYQYKEYLRMFSVVFQDFFLLALPLGENVAGTKEYNEKRVQECLEKAGFGPRLARMKKGLQTSLYRILSEDGVEISGGEAQKIALARALYKDAPMVILDEPTAALDPISEYEVYSGFRKLIGGRTALFISHRLSSCRFCDRILVFQDGRLVQEGTHKELQRDRKGLYSRMWEAQAQYYQETGAEI
ncbi:MAG TPA: ABC transporter ATP-binding protein/permease [Candidatus Blautia stercoravium]|nr:ABC transporter ATP-binding protein/permease [Candidatus Blautia stercoravium]